MSRRRGSPRWLSLEEVHAVSGQSLSKAHSRIFKLSRARTCATPARQLSGDDEFGESPREEAGIAISAPSALDGVLLLGSVASGLTSQTAYGGALIVQTGSGNPRVRGVGFVRVL